MEISNRILSEITVHMKYSKYMPELKRRETWYELVTRNMEMHIKSYPHLEQEKRFREGFWSLVKIFARLSLEFQKLARIRC